MDDTAFSILNQRSIGTSKPILAHFASENAEPQDNLGSLYVHIPFCFHKCHYCDFYSIVDRQDRQEAFAQRLCQEIKANAQITSSPTLSTIFIGGGTPTLLEPQLLKQVLETIQTSFQLSPTIEWTIESNPETLSPEILDVLAESKVNRISMGAQSFNPKHLKSLERHHNPDAVVDALTRAKAVGFDRLSVDLIYAIPDQTLDEWASDLEIALSLPIDHISAYALTYEPNTAMTKRLQRGDFDPAPDELEVEMYNHTLSQIRNLGFERYEVSNHAKPRSACTHNLAYWTNQNWLAVGPSASGHLNGVRWKNTPRLDEYINHADDGFAPICDHETTDPRRSLMDLIMMGIRISEGLNQSELITSAQRFDKADEITRAMNQCIELGWIESTQTHYKLTDDGYHFADRVARELIGALIDQNDDDQSI